MSDPVKEHKAKTGAPVPRVSVVIPLFNHVKFIEEAVRSVLGQTYEALELIIIDDGSTDGSGAVVQGIPDKRIRYFYQENQGAHNAINRGVRLARGEFLSVLNSDDIYDPRRIEECVGLLDGDSSLSAVFSSVDCIDENGGFIKSVKRKDHVWTSHLPETSFMEEESIILDLLAGNFLITTSNLFCRKTVFDKTGYFKGLRYAHDYDFFLRLSHLFKTEVIDSPLVKYRIHGANTLKPDDPEVCFEVGLTLSHFILQYGITDIMPASLRHADIYRLMAKFFNSVNTFRSDRLMMVILAFGASASENNEELFKVLSEPSNPFRTACVENFKTMVDGWTKWREANDRLIEKDKELGDAWNKWKEANERLVVKEKEAREGWSLWRETNERLIAKEKEAREGWNLWQETNEKLVATEKELVEAQEKMTFTLQQSVEKEKYIQTLLNSRSYRIGRLITWPLRKILGRS